MSSNSPYGVVPSGFAPKGQAQIITELNATFQASFGGNLNLSSSSLFGQLIGIFSEREALVWQLAEDVYNSAFPAGAQGVAVDNILALNNLKRLPASATKTNPSSSTGANGVTLYGLVLRGTAGTVVPTGSIIQNTATPPLSFTLSAPVTIGAATNAVQNVVFSAAPQTGTFTLSLTDPTTGTVLSTPPINATDTVATIQGYIRALANASSVLPFTDVIVTASGSGFAIAFGATTPTTGQPSSGGAAQPLMGYGTTATPLMSGTTAVNIAIANASIGAPAQGIGQAACTATGPNYVPAGTLTVIGSPLTGWASVTNQLDCIIGTNAETDTQALTRRASLMGSQANGPLVSIVDAVKGVSNVTTVAGFQNITNAALQNIVFSPIPTSSTATFQLSTPSGLTSPMVGSTVTPAQIQGAINATSAAYSVIVTGNVQYGFSVDFNGSMGGQTQPLLGVAPGNTTGSNITISFGRPPKSFEIVAAGGQPYDIASAILPVMPAGITSYGAPTAIATAVGTATPAQGTVAGSTVLTVNPAGVLVGNLVSGPGIAVNTTVTAVSGSSVTLSQAALTTQTVGTYTFNNAVPLYDSQGNPEVIRFSRPSIVLPYVACSLLTDYYNTPGMSTSGINSLAKFNPANILTIQQDIVSAGNQVPLGGLIIAQGTNGIFSSFASVPGILNFSIAIQLGSAPATPSVQSPTAPQNIQLLSNQQALFETINTVVNWT